MNQLLSMIPGFLLLLGVLFEAYLGRLEKERKALIQFGKNRSRWEVVKARQEKLIPFAGLVRFLDPWLIALILQDILEYTTPTWAWVLVGVAAVLYAYKDLVPYIGRHIKAYFTTPKNPHHNKKWVIHVTWCHILDTFTRHYVTSHSFIRLGLRLIVCKPFGHRWKKWEVVKYGSFGESRMCKACLVHERREKGVHSYSETHTGHWRGVKDPNAVFKREHTSPKQ